MYSFLVLARVKPEDAYEWFTFRGKKPITLDFRGKQVAIQNGQRFGVRPSSNKKFIRLVLPDEITKVITITLAQAQALAKGVGKD
jgi:hypothetical protein